MVETRYQEIWQVLEQVMDPELDQPVTELGFVDAITVNGSQVKLVLRLPTYWCSPNFAFLMLEDAHQAVLSLNWVGNAEISLKDHQSSDLLNAGLAAGKSFRDIFSEEADGDLGSLRLHFQKKAFMGRQADLITIMLRIWAVPEVVKLSVQEVTIALDDPETSLVWERYQAMRKTLGISVNPDDYALITLDGKPIADREFSRYWHQLRLTRMNREFNGDLCQGLLQIRYGG